VSILDRPAGAARLRDRRGLALGLVLGAQLMIVLDLTAVNIALPSIARGLHFSAPSLSWVLNAYALTFGGLLLLGGGRFDVAGALTSTAGMISLVYGIIRAASHGWGDPLTLAAFAAAVVLLTLFAVSESRGGLAQAGDGSLAGHRHAAVFSRQPAVGRRLLRW